MKTGFSDETPEDSKNKEGTPDENPFTKAGSGRAEEKKFSEYLEGLQRNDSEDMLMRVSSE